MLAEFYMLQPHADNIDSVPQVKGADDVAGGATEGSVEKVADAAAVSAAPAAAIEKLSHVPVVLERSLESPTDSSVHIAETMTYDMDGILPPHQNGVLIEGDPQGGSALSAPHEAAAIRRNSDALADAADRSVERNSALSVAGPESTSDRNGSTLLDTHLPNNKQRGDRSWTVRHVRLTFMLLMPC